MLLSGVHAGVRAFPGFGYCNCLGWKSANGASIRTRYQSVVIFMGMAIPVT